MAEVLGQSGFGWSRGMLHAGVGKGRERCQAEPKPGRAFPAAGHQAQTVWAGVGEAPFCFGQLLFAAGAAGWEHLQGRACRAPLPWTCAPAPPPLGMSARRTETGGRCDRVPTPGSYRPTGRHPRTSSVRLACRWLLLWSVLPMAAIRLGTTRRCSISSARLKLLCARTLGQ